MYLMNRRMPNGTSGGVGGGAGTRPRLPDPSWRGFRGIWAHPRGPPEQLTGEPESTPDTSDSALRLSPSLLTAGGGLTAREPNWPRRISSC
jgi:hypothetical protein